METRAGPVWKPAGEWVRHMTGYGGQVDGGMQIPVIGTDPDGDLDLVVAGKSGFFFENRSNNAFRGRVVPCRAPF